MNEVIITMESVSAMYPGGVRSLQDLNLSFYRNQCTALAGRNGAGKSTLLQLMMGLLQPSRGRVTILGEDSGKVQVSQLSKKIGFVLQNPDLQLFSQTVREEVAFGLKNLGFPAAQREDRIDSALRHVGLLDKHDAFPMALSKGDRALVVIASVLAMDPEILILDEPTSGQDHRGSRFIMEIAQEFLREGKSVIMATHNMDLVARYAQRLLVLGGGKVVLDGKVEEIFSRSQDLLECGIRPPRISRLGHALEAYLGREKSFLTVDELGEAVLKQYRGGVAGREKLLAAKGI